MSRASRLNAADVQARCCRIDLTPAEASALLDAIIVANQHEPSAVRQATLRSCFARVKLSRDDARRKREDVALREAGL